MNRCENLAFQLLKMRKKENHLKRKNQVRNGHFIDNYIFEYV